MTDCAVQVCRSGGIRSWYKESIIILTLMRDVPGISIEWFGTYEVVKKELVTLQGIDDDPSKLSPLYTGGRPRGRWVCGHAGVLGGVHSSRCLKVSV
jgi:hypothetical protein